MILQEKIEEMLKKKAIAPMQNEEQFLSSIFIVPTKYSGFRQVIRPISLPLFRIDFSTQSVYEIHKSSNCYTKKIECTADSLPRRYTANCGLKGS